MERQRLHPVLRGVYAVSPKITKRGWWMAAVLAAGPGAVLSHRGAAGLLGLRAATTLEVTVPGDRRLPKVIVHRSKLSPDETRIHDGIPTTGPSRTLLDLAAVVPKNHVERAMRRAETERADDPVALAELVAR